MLDRKDLKIQALLEKVSNLTTQYENQVADLRVDLTIVSQECEQLRQRIGELETPDSEPQDGSVEDPSAE